MIELNAAGLAITILLLLAFLASLYADLRDRRRPHRPPLRR